MLSEEECLDTLAEMHHFKVLTMKLLYALITIPSGKVKTTVS